MDRGPEGWSGKHLDMGLLFAIVKAGPYLIQIVR